MQLNPTFNALNKDNSFANQLPNDRFTDARLNEKILMSGPPNADSDSEFNRNSSMMTRQK